MEKEQKKKKGIRDTGFAFSRLRMNSACSPLQPVARCNLLLSHQKECTVEWMFHWDTQTVALKPLTPGLNLKNKNPGQVMQLSTELASPQRIKEVTFNEEKIQNTKKSLQNVGEVGGGMKVSKKKKKKIKMLLTFYSSGPPANIPVI